MKICWDNIKNIKLTKYGNFRDIIKNINYHYEEMCATCGEPFLKSYQCKGQFCSKSCVRFSDKIKEKISKTNSGKNNPFYGKKHSITSKRKISISRIGNKNPNYGKRLSKDHREKISISNIGKSFSVDHKQKISKANSGENSYMWKGGYASNNIPMYDTYASQIDWVESVRRSKTDKNILEIKCAYCGKWHVPKLTSIIGRIGSLNNKPGEQRLYCSESCKLDCPTYNQQKYPKGFKLNTSREVQPELRQMVLERDGWTCIKCGSKKSLHCHHLEGIRWNPLESADIDMCATLCKSCHIEVHKLPDCGNHDMKCAA